MVSLAKENLLHDKSKVALSIGGVVLAVFLIFATAGLYNGINKVVENMVTKSGADLWVTSRGSSGSLHSPSLLNSDLLQQVKQVEGVQQAVPLIRRPVAVNLSGQKLLVNVNGYDTSTGLGGPWKVASGSSTPAPGQVVVDRVLAKKVSLGIGDNLELEGKRFSIVGISDETFTMISYLVFVPASDAAAFLPPGLTNFFLVEVKPGSDPVSVQTAIETAIPQVSVTTSGQNAREAKDETVGGFLPIVTVISAVGAIVGILVVGLLIYTMTIEKSREYGVVRALGASSGYLYRVVLAQALVVAILGFIAGALISPPLTAAIRSMVPEFVVVVTPGMIAWASAVFVFTGLVASLIPLGRLVHIDPAVAFKGK